MPDEQKQTPKIYVMPEQFLVLTRSAGLPMSRASAQAPVAPPAVPPPAPAPTPVTPASTAPATPTLAPVPTPPVSGVLVVGEKRKMLIVWGVVGAVVLVGGGFAAYLALRSVPPPPTPAPRPSVPAPAPTPPPVPVPPANVPPSAPPGGAGEPAPVPPAADVDTDRDGLTDAEELLFQTDVALADTDRDGYSDALELSNLYNPSGVAPQRLIDAGLVYEYENTRYGWKVFVPRAWSAAATDQDQREVVVTTGADGETIAMSVVEGPADVGPHGADVGVRPVTTKRGASGIAKANATSDAVTEAVFPIGETLTLTIVHRIARPPARYPAAFDMLIQSIAVPAEPVSP